LSLSCEVVQKRQKWVVLGPRYLEGENTPNSGHTFSNSTHFRTCDRFWLSSAQRRIQQLTKKRRRRQIEDRRIPVKPKSADAYVRRPNDRVIHRQKKFIAHFMIPMLLNTTKKLDLKLGRHRIGTIVLLI